MKVLTSINEDTLNLGLATIAIVWDRHIALAHEFQVTVADHAPSMPGHDAMGMYDPKQRHFVFGTAGMLGLHQSEVHRGTMIMVAAHEAMHAVQHARRENMEIRVRPGESLLPDYYAHPLEVEARHESALVLKGHFPDLKGRWQFGSVDFVIPEASPYTEIWDELERRVAVVRVMSREGGSPN